MWNWIQGEFYTFLVVIERYPRIWILPCMFFLFCLVILAWLNHHLGHYFESRVVSYMTPFLDQFIINFYDKIQGKIVNRYMILGTLSLFLYGYLKYRKRVRFYC